LKKPDEYEVEFSASMAKFVRKDGDIQTSTSVAVSAEENVELRKVEITNMGQNSESLEVLSYLDMILSEANSDIVHPVYNNLFLCAEEIDGKLVVEKRFQNGEKIFLTNFVVAKDSKIRFETELDKAKIIGRQRSIKNPICLEEKTAFESKIRPSANTASAMRCEILLEPRRNFDNKFFCRNQL